MLALEYAHVFENAHDFTIGTANIFSAKNMFFGNKPEDPEEGMPGMRSKNCSTKSLA